ncbi:MAG: DUF6582 domain-containing protein [Candidatus Dormibacteria bacterium]
MKRAQARIAVGTTPLAMLTFHAAGDDSTAIVGRVTNMTLDEDGSALYEADIADTTYGRTIASLVDSSDGQPYLRGVSIRGAWLGQVKRKTVNGQLVEYADDLDLDGLDFTRSPGVNGAGIDSVTLKSALPHESTGDRTMIYESVQEARVDAVTETVDEAIEEKGAPALKSGKPAAAPTPGASSYADPGYQDDKAKRYPLDTKAHALAANSYIGQQKNAKLYTAAQLKRIKDRIRKALTKFGVQVDTKEGWLISPAVAVSEAVTEDAWPNEPGSFCVTISNGMVNISVSSYCVDPADLELAARAAMEGACQALAAIDPDTDGDIDTDGGGDDTAESADVPELVEETSPEPEIEKSPESIPDPEPTIEEEPGVSEPTTPAAETTAPTALPNVTLSPEQFDELMARVKAAPAAAPMAAEPVATAETPATETAPAAPVAETTEQLVARLVQEGVKAAVTAAVQEHVEVNGPPARKGLVTQVRETAVESASGEEWPDGWPVKDGEPLPLEKWTEQQRRKHMRPVIEQAFMGRHSVHHDAA